MRENITSSMQRAIERLEPYFKARKTQGETYSRNPKKQFSVGASREGAVSPILPAVRRQSHLQCSLQAANTA